MALLEMDLRSGDLGEAKELLRTLLSSGAEHRDRLTELAWATAGSNPDAAFVVVDALVGAASAAGNYRDAAAVLQEFAARVPNQIPALLKLVEVCVDGGLEATMHEAQAHLTDAYLGAGQAAEARVVAEVLVAREPWERAHIERFRRALMLLKVPDPDTLIAARLSGDVPFIARDVFAERIAGPIPEPERVPPPAVIVEAVSPVPEPESFVEAPPAEPVEITTPTLEPLEPAPAPDEIDLSTELGDFSARSTAPQRISLTGLPVPRNVAAPDADVNRPGGPDQAAQHMTLARTYVEMGLADEAIRALEAASKATRFRFEAASLLGRIFKDRGDTLRAVEWLERAAEAPAPTNEESWALLYDLGTMVEGSGDTARALAVFMELQSEAGDYRDVAERVERLARVEAGG
jgi:tetratricopeptide (TPR) repeat protein